MTKRSPTIYTFFFSLVMGCSSPTSTATKQHDNVDSLDISKHSVAQAWEIVCHSADQSLNDFVSFVESKYDLEMPDVWHHKLSNATFNVDGEIELPWGSPLNHDGRSPFAITEGFSVLKTSDKWHFHFDGRKIPFNAFRNTGEIKFDSLPLPDWNYMACIKTESGGIIYVIFTTAPHRYGISRLSRRGDVVWETYVGTPPKPSNTVEAGSSGIYRNCELRIAKNKVLVFGATDIGNLYLGGFDLKSGKQEIDFRIDGELQF